MACSSVGYLCETCDTARAEIQEWLQAVRRALKRQLYLLALLIALRLKDQGLQREVILATSASEVTAMCCAILRQLIGHLTKKASSDTLPPHSPNLEKAGA